MLLRITHAGINGGCETFRARGEYAFVPNRSRSSFPLGAEGAGVVAAVGEGVTNLQVGVHAQTSVRCCKLLALVLCLLLRMRMGC